MGRALSSKGTNGGNQGRPPKVDAGIPEVGQANASGIAVWCVYNQIVKLTTLKPNPRNPNRHPREQVELLASILKETGWRHPITVSERSGLIVYGHARRLAAIQNGWTEVPVEYQRFRDEHEELSALLADNQIAELSELNKTSTLDLLKDLEKMSGGLLLTGFTDDAIKKLNESQYRFTEVALKPPPTTMWVLLAIPLEAFGEMQEHVAALESRSDVVMKVNRD